MIIGIYGISGAGKNHLVNKISEVCPLFNTIDGSSMMEEIIPGGLKEFNNMGFSEKYTYREEVITQIGKTYGNSDYPTIITGHFGFLNKDNKYEVAWTEADGNTYDMIFCIEKKNSLIYHNCVTDKARKRPKLTTQQIESWQRSEINGVKKRCETLEIPFSILTDTSEVGVREFFKRLSQQHIEAFCHDLWKEKSRSFSLFDCDGTLFNGDCLDFLVEKDKINSSEIKRIFQKRKTYRFESFYEVASYYSRVPSKRMDQFLERAAGNIELDKEMLKIVQKDCEDRSVIWITSGFPEVWKSVAQRYGLKVRVLGGNNLRRSPFLISNEEKELLAHILTSKGADVFAYGDSMADAGMLSLANKAFVVISKKEREDLFSVLEAHKDFVKIDIRR